MLMNSPEEWVDRYGDYLFQYALLRLGNDAQLAEDLVQETFLSALKTGSKHEGKSSERTWLVTILKNKIIDHYRRDRKKLFEQSDFQNEEFKEEGPEAGTWKQEYAPQEWGDIPDHAFEQKEFLAVLRACLSGLPQNLASVFTMRELDGQETDTICKELGITSSNVWVMLHRARTALRKCLELNWIKEINLGTL